MAVLLIGRDHTNCSDCGAEQNMGAKRCTRCSATFSAADTVGRMPMEEAVMVHDIHNKLQGKTVPTYTVVKRRDDYVLMSSPKRREWLPTAPTSVWVAPENIELYEKEGWQQLFVKEASR